MKHEIKIVSRRMHNDWQDFQIERYWECSCGRVGPGFVDKQVSDNGVMRGGRSHATRARKKESKR